MAESTVKGKGFVLMRVGQMAISTVQLFKQQEITTKIAQKAQRDGAIENVHSERERFLSLSSKKRGNMGVGEANGWGGICC